VRPWLARVLANFTRSGSRTDRRRRVRELRAAEDEAAAPGADELLVRHEAARLVAALVSELREPHRGLVLLRFAEGLTPKEIAARRGVPEGTIRRQSKEALDQLRAAVAAHYQRDARDWRAALAPFVGVAGREDALFWKGVVLMTVKSKIALGVGAVAVVLVLLALVRGRSPVAEQAPAGTAALPVAGQVGGTAPTATTPSASPGATAPAAPPSFTTAPAVDPPRCPEKLAELRAQASRQALLSPAAFERARPNPRTESEIAPIVERVIGKLPGKPSYQVECRASVCRVGAVTDPAAGREQPRWLRALEQDADFAKLRGANRSARAETVPTKDALSGAKLLQHWIYFNVPLAAGEEHPFEASANATSCGERVAAMEKALDEHRDESLRRKVDEAERQRRFLTMPLNEALTRKLEAAFRPLSADENGVPRGKWECRGQADCRWRGPAGVMKAIDPPRLTEALGSEGLSADRVMARVDSKDDASGSKDGEAELNIHLGDKNKAPPTGEERRSQVMRVETVTPERAPQ
jgi:hypothetical protein